MYGGTMTGGAIGYIDGYSSKAGRNVSFINNWTIQNENVTNWVNYDGSTGGLVGWNSRAWSCCRLPEMEGGSVKDVRSSYRLLHMRKAFLQLPPVVLWARMISVP